MPTGVRRGHGQDVLGEMPMSDNSAFSVSFYFFLSSSLDFILCGEKSTTVPLSLWFSLVSTSA